MVSLSALRWVAVAVVVAGCGLPDGDYFGRVDDDPDPTHLHWCNSGEPEYLDPGLVSSTTGVKLVYAMFDGLTDHNMQGLPELSIATSWKPSADQRHFEFTLREDARWSNGRALDAHDFRYSIARVLHPLTASTNAERLWSLKGGALYTANRGRILLRDVPPFRRGDLVELIGFGDKVAETDAEIRELGAFPDANTRRSESELKLRDLGADESEAYATVPPNTDVTLIELGGPDESWAYVHYNERDGVYGWVAASKLTIQPHGDVVYTLREVPRAHVPGVQMTDAERKADEGAERRRGTATGKDLIMLPEQLGIRVPDDHTLVLETWGPMPALWDMTPNRIYRPVPREAVSRWPRKWTKPGKIITSGAFTLSEWKVRDYVRMKKSDTYWDRESVRLETITAYSMNDQAASANYYFVGGCQAVTSNNMPSSYFPALNGKKRGGRAYKDYKVEPYLGIYLYLINTERFPNRHFRRALSHAIDRTAIPKILNGGQIPTARFMPGTPIDRLSPEDRELCGVEEGQDGIATIVKTGELCYVPPAGVDFDLELMNKELDLAREEMGDDFPSGFTLKYNKGVEGHKLIAEYMQAEWQKNTGLSVELESQEWKTFLKDTRAGEFDIARLGWIGNFPDSEAEFLPQYRCDSPDNRTKYCSEEFEKYMDLAAATSDRKQRIEYARLAEQTMVQDVPIIPLYVYTQSHLQKPFVRDLSINLPDQVPLRKAWIDPDWKEK